MSKLARTHVVNRKVDRRRLVLGPRDRDLLNEANEPGKDDVDEVAAEAERAGPEGVEARLAGVLELDRQLLKRVAELEEALVLANRARKGRELVDKLPEVLLVPLVVGDQVLAPLEEGRRPPVGPLRGRVALDLERGLDE